MKECMPPEFLFSKICYPFIPRKMKMEFQKILSLFYKGIVLGVESMLRDFFFKIFFLVLQKERNGT